MRIGVTVAVAAAARYIVLSGKYGQDALKWAYGVLGTVIGYWPKDKKAFFLQVCFIGYEKGRYHAL